MSKKATKRRAKNLVTETYGFQSNEDRKREQRAAYHSSFDGPKSKWMKSGHVPPIKGWARRVK